MEELAVVDLVGMGFHFPPFRNPRLQDRCMCSMYQDGQEVRSHMDYILVTYCILFQDVAVRYTQHHSDHYMFLGYLWGGATNELMEYLRKAHHFPLRTLCRDFLSAPYKLFSDINTQIPDTPMFEWVRRSWISEKTPIWTTSL